MGRDTLEPSMSSPVEDRLKTRVRAVGAQRKASGARYLRFPAWVAGHLPPSDFPTPMLPGSRGSPFPELEVDLIPLCVNSKHGGPITMNSLT